MSGSALVGNPPANQNDYDIIRGFYLGYNLPATNYTEGIPLLKAPPGAPHGQNQGPGIIGPYSVLIFLLVAITSARLALRYFNKALRWGPDDYAIILGASGAVTWLAIAIAQVVVGGAGQHIYDITYVQFNMFIDLSAADTMLFYITVGLIKTSIALFNRRLTGLTSRKWMIFHNTMLGLIVSFIITAIFLELFKCRPFMKSLDLKAYGKTKKCIGVAQFGLALNIIHCLLDFALLSVPVIVFCKMKMSMSKRIRLIALFSIGCVSVIGSVNRQIVMAANALDVTWVASQSQVWTVIDLFFGCVAASLPVLNSLIPKKWRSGVPSVETPPEVSKSRHRFAPEMTHNQRPDMYGYIDGDDMSSSNDSGMDDQLRFHSEVILHESGQSNDHQVSNRQRDINEPITHQWCFNPEYDAFEDTNDDGTIRLPQQPPKILLRGSGFV